MRGTFVEIREVPLYRDLATRLKPEPESVTLRAAKVCSPNENCRSNRSRSGSQRAPEFRSMRTRLISFHDYS